MSWQRRRHAQGWEKSTAEKAINDRTHKPQGGRIPRTSCSTVETLKRLVEDQPSNTLQGLQSGIKAVLQWCPSLASVHRKLDELKLTLKVGQRVPKRRNDQDTLAERRLYVIKLRHLRQNGYRCIYVDEAGYNTWTRRRYARSPRKRGELEAIARGPRGRKTADRISLLKELSSDCISNHTPAKCAAWERHTESFYDRCLVRQKIQGI